VGDWDYVFGPGNFTVADALVWNCLPDFDGFFALRPSIYRLSSGGYNILVRTAVSVSDDKLYSLEEWTCQLCCFYGRL